MTNNEVKTQIVLNTIFDIKLFDKIIKTIDDPKAIDTLVHWFTEKLVWASSTFPGDNKQWNDFVYSLKEGLIEHPLISPDNKIKVSNATCFMVNCNWLMSSYKYQVSKLFK
jgi:hypothetical protein